MNVFLANFVNNFTFFGKYEIIEDQSLNSTFSVFLTNSENLPKFSLESLKEPESCAEIIPFLLDKYP